MWMRLTKMQWIPHHIIANEYLKIWWPILKRLKIDWIENMKILFNLLKLHEIKFNKISEVNYSWIFAIDE